MPHVPHKAEDMLLDDGYVVEANADASSGQIIRGSNAERIAPPREASAAFMGSKGNKLKSSEASRAGGQKVMVVAGFAYNGQNTFYAFLEFCRRSRPRTDYLRGEK